jgi:DNA-binding response OmpR family regulator
MKKILIVDDDAWLADSYRLILEQAGWQVTLAPTGAKAIDMIDDSQPHVVLLDIMLPDSSAPALLNELQSHSDLAKLPIILCSSLSLDDHARSQLHHYGVTQVIDKTTTTPEKVVEAAERAFYAAA